MVDHTTQFCPLQHPNLTWALLWTTNHAMNEATDMDGLGPSMTAKKFATTLTEVRDAQTVLLLTFALDVVSGAIPK